MVVGADKTIQKMHTKNLTYFLGKTVTHKGSCEDELNLSYWWDLLVFWRVSPFYSTSIPTFLIPGLFGVSQPVSSRFRRMCERVWWSYVSSAVWQWCPLRTVWCWNVLLEVGNYNIVSMSSYEFCIFYFQKSESPQEISSCCIPKRFEALTVSWLAGFLLQGQWDRGRYRRVTQVNLGTPRCPKSKRSKLGGGNSKKFLFSPRFLGEMIQFDGCISFRWVGEKPPTSKCLRAAHSGLTIFIAKRWLDGGWSPHHAFSAAAQVLRWFKCGPNRFRNNETGVST